MLLSLMLGKLLLGQKVFMCIKKSKRGLDFKITNKAMLKGARNIGNGISFPYNIEAVVLNVS